MQCIDVMWTPITQSKLCVKWHLETPGDNFNVGWVLDDSEKLILIF